MMPTASDAHSVAEERNDELHIRVTHFHSLSRRKGLRSPRNCKVIKSGLVIKETASERRGNNPADGSLLQWLPSWLSRPSCPNPLHTAVAPGLESNRKHRAVHFY